ncbi:MAG: hypothetical protein K0R78_341 [Pelosinus sp.]|jgi:hypothetical protein|nr:hypothetical protein [Pelosinus sp.]
MSIPIIFIHYGDSEYLQYSLLQAKRSNKDKDIILIGDESNNKYPFVKHVNVAESASMREFAKVYKHMNFNPHEYELFCIQRWFILRDFMVTHKIEQCYYQDSDVMLYEDIAKEELTGFDFAFCGGISAGISFINNVAALDAFCSFITNCYTQPESRLQLENMYQSIITAIPHGGICDMVFVNLYCNNTNPEKIYDLSIIRNDAVFDLNVNLTDGYEEWYGCKKIYYTNQGVLCRNLSLDKLIKFKALHFQGNAKKFMKYFLEKVPEECATPTAFDYSTCQWQEEHGLQLN